MDIGVPREQRDADYRVGLTPSRVQLLVQDGHRVFVERGAGLGSGFHDDDYQAAGAIMVYTLEEVYGQAEMVVKVAKPTRAEFQLMQDGQIVMSFMHLAAGERAKIETLLNKRVTAIAQETIQTDDGTLPVLLPISQIAGRMVPQVAAHYLENLSGGKGVLLGGVPGVPPAEVVILGGGVVGTYAARTFLGMGAHVHILDRNPRRLQALDDRFDGRVRTMVSHPVSIAKMVSFADVLVGCVLIPGARAPILVTREMVRAMRPRSLIIDVSIDQGGCVETSRPTTNRNPIFIEEGVIHYCVPNMTGVVARTATHALNNASWPYIHQIAELGIEAAMEANPSLARGVSTHNGEILSPTLMRIFEGREPLVDVSERG
ncbi:MAG: alanine dehydrogenase [Anaerolineae bacterium]